MRNELLELALRHDELAELDAAERRLALRALVVENDGPGYAAASLTELANAIDGFGPLTTLMEDEDVTDVLVNGPLEIWIERKGRLSRASPAFRDEQDLRAFIDRLLSVAGARADSSRPISDARLRDGSRIHVVLPPVAPAGPLVSIRRFPREPPTLADLIAWGMMDELQAARLRAAVDNKATMAISGGTGCGKTTLLNALLGEIADGERVVLLEETPELRPGCSHCVGLLTREVNVEGSGAVQLADLVRAALRMRPDRIVIGEVRGPEALAALAAMSVGHEGSMVTVHARSVHDVVDRLVSLALLAGGGASEESLRHQVSSAFSLFVHLERTVEGDRRISQIVALR